MAVKEAFPEATIIRPSDMYGDRDHFLWRFTRWNRRQWKKVPLWNGGYNIFKQPVYVADVAHGITNAVYDDSSPGVTYEFFGPKRYEMREFVKYVNRCLNKKEPEYNVRLQYQLKY